jgi:hypothetical protein
VRRVQQAEQREQLGARAEQLGPHLVPLRRGAREELLRPRVAVGEDALHALRVAARRGQRLRLLAHGRPQATRRAIERAQVEAVAVGRAVAARREPAGVGEDLEVPAHRRLRQLHDGAQLGHRQLMALQQEEQPRADGIGEGREAVVEGGVFHPYIRMKGCSFAAPRQPTPRSSADVPPIISRPT